jgi:hypothetical protein
MSISTTSAGRLRQLHGLAPGGRLADGFQIWRQVDQDLESGAQQRLDGREATLLVRAVNELLGTHKVIGR